MKKQTIVSDRSLTIQETYDARPRRWWLYTLIMSAFAPSAY